MKFEKGEPRPANAGRRAGSPNKTPVRLREIILGALAINGGAKWLAQKAEEEPAAFMILLGKVLPLTIAGDKENPLEIRVTRAELAAEAKRRIDEAFKEYRPPQTIEHDALVSLPDPPAQSSEQPPREYARDGPLAAAPGVSRLPMRYRPPRPVGDWSG